MALPTLLCSNLSAPLTDVRFGNGRTYSRFRISCSTIPQAQSKGNDSRPDTNRRSANYLPSFWEYKHLEPLETVHDHEEGSRERVMQMKDEVKGIINDREMQPLDKLELIDVVQRLGLEYHFETEIKDALSLIRAQDSNGGSEFNELHSTSLLFRLLRHHGLPIQQGMRTI